YVRGAFKLARSRVKIFRGVGHLLLLPVRCIYFAQKRTLECIGIRKLDWSAERLRLQGALKGQFPVDRTKSVWRGDRALLGSGQQAHEGDVESRLPLFKHGDPGCATTIQGDQSGDKKEELELWY
ncbi:hypothetical protein PFISCL1PPCAC_17046, partial [Pristionchus fissidentatus]